METLNENDIDRLTSMQNQLTRMRKREAANTASIDYMFADVISSLHELRQHLQTRCGVPVDKDLD